MKVVGLDLSLSSTGVASNLGWCDRIVTKPNGHGGGFGRLRHIRAEVMSFVDGADLVVVEGLAVASQTGQHLTRAGLWHLVMESVDLRGIPWAQVPPATLKKYATGKGNVGKDEMLAAVIRRFPKVDVTGNDQADAVALAAMGADHLGAPMAFVPETHRASLAKVVWPDASA